MSGEGKTFKIKILKDGPYLVLGGIPLSEKIIYPTAKTYEYRKGKEYPLNQEYALCRCGHSKNPPFCDGSHQRIGFNGEETASRENYAVRATLQKGPNLYLMDDDRCAFARFCHRQGKDAWELTDYSDDPYLRKEAIKAACDCPSGRLVALDRELRPIEYDHKPSIEILQDPSMNVSAAIFVKGYIPIESSDGFIYEVRNRVALCRCGGSSNKPFCDMTHFTNSFRDRK